MKRLILMRHAKSSWADPGQLDLDRPLNGRGRRDAPKMGVWMRERDYLPDHALVSISNRTRQTWQGVASVLGERPVEYVRDLYHADPDQMMAVLEKVAADTVLMIGHQPGIGEMAARLAKNMPESEDFDRYPTAATAVFDFDIPRWDEIDWRIGKLIDFAVPRKLG